MIDEQTNPEIDGFERDVEVDTGPEPPPTCVWPDVWRDCGGCQGCVDCEAGSGA
jgi:hypothetical protein